MRWPATLSTPGSPDLNAKESTAKRVAKGLRQSQRFGKRSVMRSEPPSREARNLAELEIEHRAGRAARAHGIADDVCMELVRLPIAAGDPLQNLEKLSLVHSWQTPCCRTTSESHVARRIESPRELPGHRGHGRQERGGRLGRDARLASVLRLSAHALHQNKSVDYAQVVADGWRNLWDERLMFLEPESEHSSASAAEGPALGGGR